MAARGACRVCTLVGVLVGVGALNWGLYGWLQLDLVAKLLGPMTFGAKIVYGLIGLAGVVKLISLVKACPCQCGEKSAKT